MFILVTSQAYTEINPNNLYAQKIYHKEGVINYDQKCMDSRYREGIRKISVYSVPTVEVIHFTQMSQNLIYLYSLIDEIQKREFIFAEDSYLLFFLAFS